MKPQPPRINIELGEKEAEGIYANLALISHSPSEIIRIIMTPPHAKMLHKALEENIKKFENQFGPIKLHGKEQKNIGFAASEEEEESK
jgi:hypothetical protein